MKIFIRFVFNHEEQPESHAHACRDADGFLNLTPSKKPVIFVPKKLFSESLLSTCKFNLNQDTGG
jgi:hypothetical protein